MESVTIRAMKFSGKVIKGVQIGAKFGIATANVALNKEIDLEEGVYLVSVQILGKTWDGLLHFGARKTFGGEFSVEVHILDFSADIYEQMIDVEVLKFLRPVKKFANGDALFTQIETDITQARKYFLRKKIVQKWQGCVESDLRERAALAVEKLARNDDFLAREHVLAYAPIAQELDFVADLLRRFPMKTYYFPRVVGDEMTFHASDYEDLVLGAFGVKEPLETAPLFKADQPFFCLVPALAVDNQGHRLGRGAGFYDRFLAELRQKSADPRSGSRTSFLATTVVPKFCYFTKIPHEAHDEKVDEVVMV